MAYHIITYGCQMNRSDSERIAAVLGKQGHKKARLPERADLVIINMCSVRQKPVDKVKNQVRALSRLPNPSQIIITGCVLEQDKKELEKLGAKIQTFKQTAGALLCSGLVPITRGCSNFCSYCVVPYTRGREKHRRKKTILAEIKHLIKKGIKEITLLGQNVNSYPNFVGLLKNITKLKGDFKIKFITNHPKDFSDELIKEIAGNPKIIKYVHLPVQSGDNTILKKMNRKYTRAKYLSLVKKIKQRIPNVVLTTDVIVGFPGETKKQFQNTVDLFKKVKFNNAFIAKYSPRPGTAAFRLKDNVSLEEKKHREQELRKLTVQTTRQLPRQTILNHNSTPLPPFLPPLIVITGPTASGKTALSIKLAKKFNGEIVSADSRQIYKQMNIGTGKITKKEMENIPHHLVDIISPKTRFSTSQFQKKAIKVIKDVHKRGKLPILVGGSPFYIYPVVDGWLFPKMKTNQKLRASLEKKSASQLLSILKKLAPERAETIEPKNKRRLIRAIEIAKTLGKVPKIEKKPMFNCKIIGIQLTPNQLKQNISKRVDKMLKNGLEKEVRALAKKYGFNAPGMQSIGYAEWRDYLQGKAGKKEITERIKRNTCRLAKRQMMWFKRDKRISWLSPKNYKKIEGSAKPMLN